MIARFGAWFRFGLGEVGTAIAALESIGRVHGAAILTGDISGRFLAMSSDNLTAVTLHPFRKIGPALLAMGVARRVAGVAIGAGDVRPGLGSFDFGFIGDQFFLGRLMKFNIFWLG